jgi:hypothetical protein
METQTWGISGPRFLAVYAVLLALTVLVAVIDRRRRTGGPVRVDPGMPLDAYEVAVLNGGEQLAATAAVANLRKVGALRVDGDAVEPAGPLPPGAHPVERAVYDSVLRGGRRRAAFVPVLARNVRELGEIRGRLVQLGLLWDRGRARRMRALLLWFVPVLGLGRTRAGRRLLDGLRRAGRRPAGPAGRCRSGWRPARSPCWAPTSCGTRTPSWPARSGSTGSRAAARGAACPAAAARAAAVAAGAVAAAGAADERPAGPAGPRDRVAAGAGRVHRRARRRW